MKWLSNTIDTSFCISELQEALARSPAEEYRPGQPVHQYSRHQRADGRGACVSNNPLDALKAEGRCWGIFFGVWATASENTLAFRPLLGLLLLVDQQTLRLRGYNLQQPRPSHRCAHQGFFFHSCCWRSRQSRLAAKGKTR